MRPLLSLVVQRNARRLAAVARHDNLLRPSSSRKFHRHPLVNLCKHYPSTIRSTTTTTTTFFPTTRFHSSSSSVVVEAYEPTPSHVHEDHSNDNLSSSNVNATDCIKLILTELKESSVEVAARSFLTSIVHNNNPPVDNDAALDIILNTINKDPQQSEALVKTLQNLAKTEDDETANSQDPDLVASSWRPNRNHYRRVIQGWHDYDPPSAKRSQALVEWMNGQAGLEYEMDACNLVLATWAKKCHAEGAQAFLEQLGARRGLKLDLTSFSHVLDAWAASKSPMAPKRAELLLSWMSKRKVEPNAKCWLRVIECWSKAKRKGSEDRIKALLGQLKQHLHQNPSEIDPTTIQTATLGLLNAYQKIGNGHRSEEVLLDFVNEYEKDMKTVPPPSREMCLSVLTTWSKSRSSNRAIRAEKLLLRMERDEVFPQPDVACLTAVLHCFATSNRPDAAERAEALLRRMETEGEVDDGNKNIIEGNLVSWTCVLNAWAHSGPDSQFTDSVHVQAERIYREILDRGLEPDRFVYGGLITAWGRCKNNNDSIFKVEEYFENVKALKPPNDPMTVVEYTATLQAYANYVSGHVEKSRMCVARVETLLEEMLDSGEERLKPNTLTFAAVLKCIAAARRIPDRLSKAESVLRIMESEGVERSPYIIGLVHKCAVHEKGNRLERAA